MNSKSRGSGVNPDLAREREGCQFDQEEITNLIDGSKAKTEHRRRTQDMFLNIKGLVDEDTVLESLGAEARYEYDLRKTAELFAAARTLAGDAATMDELGQFMSQGGALAMPEGHPLSLHFAVFIPAIYSLATPEQQRRWLDKSRSLEMIGAYAQTELGHGSFLRGLETTATYDSSSKEFVLNSPSLSSFKWWPGGMGKTANWAIVMAQLITQGQEKGPHAFMVQLRDEHSHKTLPGIKIGVIGEKFGMNTADNGYLGFKQVRIPLENMFKKNAQVLKDGTYMKPKMAQLNYGAMMHVRCGIAVGMTKSLQKATTIAVRYSAVRRQSELVEGDKEPQVMDYQTQQEKLFPALAMCFAFSFAAEKLWEDYAVNSRLLEKGDLSQLPKLHALSSGLKVLSTQECSDQMDILRRACGGHGFLASSNLPRLWTGTTAARTLEGENTVLLLQVARFLAKSVDGSSGTARATFGKDKAHSSLFESVYKGKLKAALQKVNNDPRGKVHPSLAWNAHGVDLCEAADAFVRAFVMAEFERRLQQDKLSPAVKKVVGNLHELLSVHWMLQRKGDFILHARVTAALLKDLKERRDFLLAAVRPNAVSIVDAFDFPDEVLRSTLGSYDGNAYERLFQAALRSPLNRTDAVTPSALRSLKSLTAAKM